MQLPSCWWTFLTTDPVRLERQPEDGACHALRLSIAQVRLHGKAATLLCPTPADLAATYKDDC